MSGDGKPAAPPLTPEQREEGARRCKEARRKRADARARISRMEISAASLLDSDDKALRRMKVCDLLRSLPGMGPAGARSAMRACGIAEDRRISTIGDRQRAELRSWISSYQSRLLRRRADGGTPGAEDGD